MESCRANGLLHACPRMSMHTHQNCCCCSTSQARCRSAAATAGTQQQAMLQANLSAGPSILLRCHAPQALRCQQDHRTEQLPQLLLPAICWPAQLQHHHAARRAVHCLLARSPSLLPCRSASCSFPPAAAPAAHAPRPYCHRCCHRRKQLMQRPSASAACRSHSLGGPVQGRTGRQR